MAETSTHSQAQALADGVVPRAIVDRTEGRWLKAMAAMLLVMAVVIIATAITDRLHPASNVEVIDAQTLHLQGEFVESNLGTAIEPDGSATVRVLAETYAFVPACVVVPAGTPVRFRLTSADVIHGFLLPDTNVNTMVVPGFVAEVRTKFAEPHGYAMPCHEYCGLGHQAMWGHVSVVPKERFAGMTPLERTRCARQ